MSNPGFNDPVTITAPRWAFDSLIVAGQIEYDRRRQAHPNDTDAGRFKDAWKIVHFYLNLGPESGDEAVAVSTGAFWREHWP